MALLADKQELNENMTLVETKNEDKEEQIGRQDAMSECRRVLMSPERLFNDK